VVAEQLGFRLGMYAENDVFSLSVSKSDNQNAHVGGIFSHLTKAFDCINHETLLAGLHLSGIQGASAN
jgi:hypothetical protein